MTSLVDASIHRMCLALVVFVGMGCVSVRAQALPADPVPVLIELFTSEGCSDCPPADDLLAQIDAKQPFVGTHAIVLSEHVTYWNRQGWTDPFSLDAMTERQQQYVQRFGLRDSYTPQMVVDGTTQFVGSDVKALIAAVAGVTKNPKQKIEIADAGWQNGAAQFSVHAPAESNERMIAVLAADATVQKVSAGENSGRTLRHVAVVRVMREFTSDSADGRALKLSGGSLDHKSEAGGPLRLVVFLVDHKTGRVLGAAERTLDR